MKEALCCRTVSERAEMGVQERKYGRLSEVGSRLDLMWAWGEAIGAI